jgi:hypothetical protein
MGIDPYWKLWQYLFSAWVTLGRGGQSFVALASIQFLEREMCPWAISKCFGDLVSNTSA